MPGTTDQGVYVVPTPTDPPDMSYWIDQLGQGVENKALEHTSGSRKRVHIVTGLTGTTDATGFCTFNHGAPFTPRVCQVVLARSGLSFAYLISVDAPTATQVTARFGIWNGDTTMNSAALGANAISIISWE